MPKFGKLNFQKSKLQFSDKNKTMMHANTQGNFTVDDIRAQLKSMSESLQKANKTGIIGVSYHYKDEKRYKPAVMNTFGDFKVFDDTYENQAGAGEIDKVQFVVINQNDGTNKYMRAKNQLDASSVLKKLFNK